MTDVTQQLDDALRELLVAVHYADPPKNYGTEDEPNICHEARIPVGFVEPAHRALTAFEASRAALKEEVERLREVSDERIEQAAARMHDHLSPSGPPWPIFTELDPQMANRIRGLARAALGGGG